MFKEAEKGNKEVNVERAEEILASNAEIVAVNCPFCMTMVKDGVKHFNKEDTIQIMDLSELISENLGL